MAGLSASNLQSTALLWLDWSSMLRRPEASSREAETGITVANLAMT